MSFMETLIFENHKRLNNLIKKYESKFEGISSDLKSAIENNSQDKIIECQTAIKAYDEILKDLKALNENFI